MSVNYYTSTDYLAYLSAVLGYSAGEGDIFRSPLPIPPELDATRRKGWVIEIEQGSHQFGIGDGQGNPYTTTTWGYSLPGQPSGYLGPTILAESGSFVSVKWQNSLPIGDHLLPVDTTVHIATPTRFPLSEGSIPTVTHLHGGKNESESDGLPDQWAIQKNREVGPLWHDPVFQYDNDQQAATLWYHDHALGITRLNVYSGLAGFYLLTDEVEQELVSPTDNGPATLPGHAFDVPLAIQDKAFTPEGELYYPAYKTDVLPGTQETVGDVVPEDFYNANGDGAPSAVPEMFGNMITVNGAVWPTLDVDEGMWRFRMLNGSDSRFYLLDFEDDDANADPTAFLVGTDGGLLPYAIELTGPFVLEPGGRLDIVVNFAGLAEDTNVILKNYGPVFEPFKGLNDDGSLARGVTAADAIQVDDQGDPVLVDNVMKFSVTLPDIAGNDDLALHDGAPLAGGTFVTLNPDDTIEIRKLALFEGEDEFGRIQPLLGLAQNGEDIGGNHVDYGPLAWASPVTEDPLLGSTELWEWFNFSEDAHPIHVHLPQMQVVERHKIFFQDDVIAPDGLPDDLTGNGDLDYAEIGPEFLTPEGELDWSAPGLPQADVFIFSVEIELAPEETGWQDTVWIGPSEMLSAVMTFEEAGSYVWHCHILSHEDHEMMRPYEVIDPMMDLA